MTDEPNPFAKVVDSIMEREFPNAHPANDWALRKVTGIGLEKGMQIGEACYHAASAAYLTSLADEMEREPLGWNPLHWIGRAFYIGAFRLAAKMLMHANLSPIDWKRP